ncbi:uncharacterized [Tachysurus ichikawai]
MAQAAKQLRKNKDLAEAAAQELREKEEEKIKKRNRSRDRRRKTPADWFVDCAAAALVRDSFSQEMQKEMQEEEGVSGDLEMIG